MPSYRFGKHPPKVDYRTLRFRDYLTLGLAAPPPAYDVLAACVYPKLKTTDPTVLFPMDGNDTKGDCTIAALAHAETVFQGMLGTEKMMTKNAVLKLYFHLSGGLDTGLNELDVLNYWNKHTVSHDKLLRYVSIDPRNHTHIQQAIQMFGGVYLGFHVQQDCLSDFDARKPWTPGPLLNEGHAVYAIAYDPTGVTVLTWGNTQQATWDWWDECVDEAYALQPPEAREPGFAPGFNFAQLKIDLDAVAS